MCGEPSCEWSEGVKHGSTKRYDECGCELCCQRGEINKDPAGALIYATRQTTRGKKRRKQNNKLFAAKWLATFLTKPERPAGEPKSWQPVD